MKIKSIILLVIALILISAGIFLIAQSLSKGNQGEGAVCTQDAQQCSDGSYVGRNPDNNCEFYPCPIPNSGSTPQNYNVELKGYAFSPANLTIKVGDTIIWTNSDLVIHTVTSDTGNELSSSSLSNNGTFSHTFSTAGTFAYHCSPHSSMKATIVVK